MTVALVGAMWMCSLALMQQLQEQEQEQKMAWWGTIQDITDIMGELIRHGQYRGSQGKGKSDSLCYIIVKTHP